VWIIPKPLQQLSGVLATEGIISDSAEFCQACASSLLVRSKVTQSRIWSQKLKAGGFVNFLFGRTLKPSHANSFETWLISLSRAILASRSVLPADEAVPTTRDICGPLCGGQLRLFDPDTSSLKMWKATSASDCVKSLPNWLCSDTEWRTAVANQRGEYSRRLKLVRPRIAKGSSSSPKDRMQKDAWTTPCANWLNGSTREDFWPSLVEQVNWPTPDLAPMAPNTGSNKVNTPKSFKDALDWRTPGAMSENQARGLGSHPDKRKEQGRQINLTDQMVQFGNWKTPKADERGQYQRDRGTRGLERPNLTGQAKELARPTPRSSDSENRTTRNTPSHGKTHGKTLAGEAASARPTPRNRDWKGEGHPNCLPNVVHGSGPTSSPDPENSNTSGNRQESSKLNADWVEALMDVPPMWTDCGCSATASIPLRPPSHL